MVIYYGTFRGSNGEENYKETGPVLEEKWAERESTLPG
jgi:hypothetical protein